MKTKIYIFLFYGYADWEISFITPELNRSEDFELIYCSKDGQPVRSMGGLSVYSDIALDKIDAEDVDILILPGGSAWEKGGNTEIDELVNTLFHSDKSIGAICAATTYLGQKGILDNLNHTSNDLNYLKGAAPEYAGDDHYVNELAISDKNIITANGIGPIEFAREVFKKVNLYDEKNLDAWFQLFKHGIWSGEIN